MAADTTMGDAEPVIEGLAEAERILAELASSYFPRIDLEPETVAPAAGTPLVDTASRYRVLLEQIPAVVFIGHMDRGLGEAYVSPHIEAVLGFTQREWIEEPIRWYRQIHSDDKVRWSLDAARFFLTGEPLHATYRVVSEDGRVIWFQCEAKMVRREDGRPLLVHGVGFDVTELKRTEESLKEALAAANAANQAKSDFLANMSHEIRTPINGILGMTTLALETALTHEQRDYLEIVQSSANSLLALVNDILDLSKIEARQLRIDPAGFDPRLLIEETARLLAPLATSKGLELLCLVRAGVPDAVVGDAARFRQILVNLIGNAIKFSDRGEVALRVEAAERTATTILIHCQVADTGVGIPKEKQQLIFDRFSQVDSSSKRRHGGAGLGLTICATLAEMMGGRVWLESEPGVGSTFHVTLRFETLSSAEAKATHLSRVRGMRVLVVDRSASGRAILSEMLEELGCHAICVAPGDAAREMLIRDRDDEPVSLVLADGPIPGIHLEQPSRIGLGGVVERRFAVLHPGVAGPIWRRWEEATVTGYIAKPVWRSHLANALRNHATPAPLLPPETAKPETPPPAQAGMRVLVAEDNVINQKVAVRMLEKRGHRATVASNGLEAVERVRDERFDVILMDLQMPEMDGFEALAEIRRIERASGRRTPVIALTAHAMEGDREKCIEAGMDGHISKPIVPAKLFEAVEKFGVQPSDG